MTDAYLHYDAVAADYHQHYDIELLAETGKYPANHIRLEILKERVRDAKLRSLYEVGVGEGTPLATLASMGLSVAGCDIADRMVEEAKRTFLREGLDPELIKWGDVSERSTLPVGDDVESFGAVVAFGVLPHVNDDTEMLKNIYDMTSPGGLVFVEFRNALFSLFTMNRYTKAFIVNDLLKGASENIRQTVGDHLERVLAMDLPPVRGQDGDDPGYDRVLSRFHVPFDLLETFESCGFVHSRIHWYHYHAAPPTLQDELGDEFRQGSLALEGESSWRGLFLCSAGVIEAERPAS